MKKKIIVFTLLAAFIIIIINSLMVLNKVREAVDQVNKYEKISKIEIDNSFCISVPFVKTFLKTDIYLMDKNKKEIILLLKNSKIFYSEDNININSIISINKKNIFNKLVFFKGSESEKTRIIFNKIIKQNVGESALSININKSKNIYFVDFDYTNKLFEFKSKDTLEYIDNPLKKTISINNKEYKLPGYEIILKNSKSEFILFDRNLSREFIYNIYLLNYEYTDNKRVYNKYLFDIDNIKTLSKKKFEKEVSKHIIKFKNQKLGFFNLFTDPIANIYLNKDLNRVIEYNENIYLIQGLLRYMVLYNNGGVL